MFATRGWQKLALAMNLSGTILLFFSFQATSSNVKIVTTEDGARTALCVEGRGLIVSEPGGGFGFGTSKCPEWERARPAAVVNIEKPFLVTIGFILIAVGFFVQYLSAPIRSQSTA
ncbi:MAG: hypothetical protein M3Y27_18090 [Acidobacteriota bacterium]|nr:hypothetical protein [Acidobacteriota bacterium]